MKLKGRRQSNNVQLLSSRDVVKGGRKITIVPNANSPSVYDVLPGARSRKQLENKRAERVGRAMGVGNQLDAIEKMGKPTSNGVKKKRVGK